MVLLLEADLWQQLPVAAMAFVVVWQVAREKSPEAAEFRTILVGLSGRQTDQVKNLASACPPGIY